MRPGHRGIWQEPLRTGKYAINPRVYAAEIVPTFILTLNWADATSEAHDLDAQLSSIVGKSREGFVFKIDLQVQIHVPDTKAPKVISMVGTMRNLVSEVLQSRGGQPLPQHAAGARGGASSSRPARRCRRAAFEAITGYLSQYEVETKGVYIQDVVFPEELVRRAHPARDRQPGEGDLRGAAARGDVAHRDGEGEGHGRTCRSQLASAQVGVQIKTNEAQAREQEAKGEAAYVQLTGEAEADAAPGHRSRRGQGHRGARPRPGHRASRRSSEAIGEAATAVVAVANAVADGHITVVPEVLVTGGGGGRSTAWRPR